jgi:hypothetical protein
MKRQHQLEIKRCFDIDEPTVFRRRERAVSSNARRGLASALMCGGSLLAVPVAIGGTRPPKNWSRYYPSTIPITGKIRNSSIKR